MCAAPHKNVDRHDKLLVVHSHRCVQRRDSTRREATVMFQEKNRVTLCSGATASCESCSANSFLKAGSASSASSHSPDSCASVSAASTAYSAGLYSAMGSSPYPACWRNHATTQLRRSQRLRHGDRSRTITGHSDPGRRDKVNYAAERCIERPCPQIGSRPRRTAIFLDEQRVVC